MRHTRPLGTRQPGWTKTATVRAGTLNVDDEQSYAADVATLSAPSRWTGLSETLPLSPGTNGRPHRAATI